jgi:hypothetical protein
MSAIASSPHLSMPRHDRGASSVFKVLFWIHQVLLGLPSMGFGFDLLIQGKAQGIINVIGLFLAWIGGTLVWGLAALIHQQPVYDLPPVFAAIAENIARLEKMQEHASAVSAVADAIGPGHHAESNGLASMPLDPDNAIFDPLSNLPTGSRIERKFRRRVAFLPDGSVIGETDSGVSKFKTFEEWQRAIGE